ncbi:hypothetical protein D3C78_1573220 [compost metagenome]
MFDLFQERFALAVVIDQLLAQVNVDRVRLLLRLVRLLEPDLGFEIDAKALRVILDLLDFAPVNQALVVLQILDLLEERSIGRRVLANLQQLALEQVLVREVRHKTLHRVGEDTGLVGCRIMGAMNVITVGR